MYDYLFVYGTLRPEAAGAFPEAREAFSRIERHCRYLGEAHMRGRLHRVSWYPALVDSPNVRDEVMGDLFIISRPRKVLPLLDAYENASAARSPRRDYVRTRRPAVLTNGDIVSAWVYVYNKPSAVGARIMSGDFLEASVGATLACPAKPWRSRAGARTRRTR